MGKFGETVCSKPKGAPQEKPKTKHTIPNGPKSDSTDADSPNHAEMRSK